MKLTLDQIEEIAKRAEKHVRRTARFEDLAPIFEKFIERKLSFTECFRFLRNEGVVLEEEKWSVRNAFYKLKQSGKTEK